MNYKDQERRSAERLKNEPEDEDDFSAGMLNDCMMEFCDEPMGFLFTFLPFASEDPVNGEKKAKRGKWKPYWEIFIFFGYETIMEMRKLMFL